MISTLIYFSLLVLGMFGSLTSSRPLLAPLSSRGYASKKVFAHYMVGLTDGQTAAQWQKDILQAQAAGIDGFALNIGSSDAWNGEQLPLAYKTAAASNFTLFLSFDMAASSWTVDQVNSLVNQFKSSTSQFKVNGLPMVSTFEGPDWADNWASVRAATGGIYLVPDWASLGATGVASKLSLIDGAFSWAAWPTANQKIIDAASDLAYKTTLGSKPYMMGVSPYFYTNLPQYDKNWYSSSDSLWFDRWKQVLDVQPQFVELITWNDYGESSYLNTPVSEQIVDGAQGYVEGFDHSAFLYPLPYFVRAYKAGTSDVPLPSGEGAMAWYRTTPAAAGSDGGTVWGQGGSAPATDGTSNVVSVIALAETACEVTVSIGGDSETVSPVESVGKAHFYQVSFAGKSGAVTVTMNGKSATGPAIQDSTSDGTVNFNAVTIQL